MILIPKYVIDQCVIMTALTQNFSNISDSSSSAIINHGLDIVETAVSSVSTREIQPPDLYNDYLLTDTLIPTQFVVDAKPFIERPFYLMTVDWDVSTGRGDILPSQFSQLPGDVLRSNPSLLSATKIASLYRCDLELVISVAGTITHSGCVVAGVIPPIFGVIDTSLSQLALINTILTGPHVRLFANEATSCILKVPWYCNTEMATLDLEPKTTYLPSIDITPINGNYGTLVFLVLNPLSPSAGSSTSLKITVEAVFKSLDMRVPTPRYVRWVTQSSFLTTMGTALADNLASKAKTVSADFIDKARSYLRARTGLHNPNSAIIAQRVITTERNFLNTIDTQTYFETLDSKLGTNRIVDCPIFNTSTDEMMLQHILSKKQYLGSFRVNVNDTTGTLLWSRPISPNQFTFNNSQSANTFSNNIRLIHSLSRAWRGDLKITIEAVMNNKQQVKLRLLQMYNPSVSCISSFPDYRTILNAPSHLMEFSAGGQTHEIILPYLCRNELTPCAVDQYAESLFHGQYYIYVAQPMANSGDSPVDIYFNVYIQGTPSLQFFGYATNPLQTIFPAPIIAPPINFSFTTQSMNVMNEPQKQDDKTPETDPIDYVNRLQRIDSVRDFIRRTYNVAKYSKVLTPGFNFIPFDIDQIYGESPSTVPSWDNPMRALASMYYGKFPSTRFQLRVLSYKKDKTENIATSVYYFPQQQYAYAPEGLTYGTIITEAIASLTLGDQNIDFPVPYQNIPITWNQTLSSNEFAIPNTSLFKFVGGPKKNNARAYLDPDHKFATQDCGALVFVLFNPYTEDFPVELLVNAGASDECRFGFHSVAPYVTMPIAAGDILAYGVGSVNNKDNLPSLTAVSYINFTRE